jgi:hypothetical protein
MRTYAGTLLLEDIFDYIPTTNADIYNLGLAVFEPNILVVENNCHTTLGKFQTIDFEAEGLTELSTETVLSYNRITTLLSQGIYSAATRHSSTCISKGGICVRCYKATYPDKSVPAVNDRVTLKPEYLVNAEIIRATPTNNIYSLVTDSAQYDKYNVFLAGVLLVNGTDYSITGNTLTLSVTIASETNLVIRFLRIDRRPFLSWLSTTYAGALLGMKPLVGEQLPIRPLFLASTLTENRLQSISELIKASGKIPIDYTEYSDLIKDPLEKALYMLAIFSIYYNVTS